MVDVVFWIKLSFVVLRKVQYKGIATMGANGDAHGPQCSLVLLFLPTLTRSEVTPRQALATKLS